MKPDVTRSRPDRGPETGVRLIAVDMDGTLLDPGGELSRGAPTSVARARAQGLHVVPATGRPDRLVWELAAQAGLGPLGVCSNGAVLIDLEAGTIIARSGFSGAEAVALVDIIRDRVPGVALAADQGDRFVHERSVLDGLDLAPSRGRMLTGDIRGRVGDGCLKFVARRADLSSLELAALLAPVLHAGQTAPDPRPAGPAEGAGMDRLGAGDLAEVTASDIAWVDIGPAGLNKATGLADVCRRLGVSLNQVAALGDHYNDLPMLRAAGLAGAMGNAIDEVLAVADIVVGTNADGGAGAFIDRIVEATSH